MDNSDLYALGCDDTADRMISMIKAEYNKVTASLIGEHNGQERLRKYAEQQAYFNAIQLIRERKYEVPQ